MGRFINADALASTGQGLLGNNMFAYCLNNPVNYSDARGKRSQVCIDDHFNAMRMPWQDSPTGGKSAYSMIRSSGPDNPWITPLIYKYVTNTDEQVVLNAKYFAFYNGILVIKTSFDRCGYFGIMFINKLATADDVRHEYGHSAQMEQLGVIRYALCIGLPSWLEWGTCQSYYDRPWEVVADIEGGVLSRSHSAAVIQAGYDYLEMSKEYGILVWFTIQ